MTNQIHCTTRIGLNSLNGTAKNRHLNPFPSHFPRKKPKTITIKRVHLIFEASHDNSNKINHFSKGFTSRNRFFKTLKRWSSNG
jgi:hypothetical protein